MYSKFSRHATCAVALLIAACSALPWRNEPVGEEVNVAFVMKNNLLYVSSAAIDGLQGRFLIGSSAPRTILDNHFAQTLDRTNSNTLQLNQRQSLRMVPLFADLHGIADAIIGADVWGNHAVTLDYRAGLLTFQRDGIHPDGMRLFHYGDEPMIDVVVDGRTIQAIVDTTSPDTLVLPRLGGPGGRRTVRVQIAGSEFGSVDVGLGDVSAARLGNRLLSRFLVTIDYGKHEVGLWRDPRM
jgi:hypothetical protein